MKKYSDRDKKWSMFDGVTGMFFSGVDAFWLGHSALRTIEGGVETPFFLKL